MATEPTLSIEVTMPLGPLRLDAAIHSTSARIAIVGPSGAGKSTLLRILGGLEPAATGRISCRGSVWLDTAHRVRVAPWERRAAWVPQDSRLFPHRSVRENLAFGGADDRRIGAMADRLAIGSLLDRMPRHLSGGEAQRVALGRALLARPRLLLLDEPFASLDRPTRESVTEFLQVWAAELGLPLVMVSHDERDVAALAEEVWQMSGGKTDGRLPSPPRGY